MDNEVPSSFPINRTTEEKYRNDLAAHYKNLPPKDKEKPKHTKTKTHLSDEEVLNLVKEINVYFANFDQNLLVLIHKNGPATTLNIISSQTHELIREISIDELLDVARNLRNHTLSLIDKKV